MEGNVICPSCELKVEPWREQCPRCNVDLRPVDPAAVVPEPAKPAHQADDAVERPVDTAAGRLTRAIRRRPDRLGLAALALAFVVLVAALLIDLRTGTPPRSNAPAGSTPQPNDGVFPEPGSSAANATPGSPSPDPSDPNEALRLSEADASQELDRQAGMDSPEIARLPGNWVPQVSGKCVGISVDIGPAWVPDGFPETPAVTIQQIVAFHRSLRRRFGAVTTRPTQVGFPSDTATAGVCVQRELWYSIVPQPFAGADAANDWCAANVPPIHECQALYVARSGETARTVARG